MRRIVDDGVLGLQMICLVLLGGLSVFPLVTGCILLRLWKANPLFVKLQGQLYSINSIIQEAVSGIRIIKACVREAYEKAQFGKANETLVKTQLRMLVIFTFMNPVANALMYGVVAVILYTGSFQAAAGRPHNAGGYHGVCHLHYPTSQ